MKKRKDLPQSQLYDSMYAPVQTTVKDKNYEEVFKLDYVKSEQKRLRKELHGYRGRIHRILSWIWKSAFSNFGEEWIFLAFLGVLVAHISYMIDKGSYMCNVSRMRLYSELAYHPWAKYFAWICLPVCLCMFSAGFVKILSPLANGSGLPEIKTILRGVPIDGFLSFRTLVAKVVGITSTLGSSMPLGKEGPLIHISSCCVHLLGKLTSFQGIYQNESRRAEMIAAAAAVGVGCTFGAPIGGVLFSIELTTAYFAVRNYWRGFCAAVWGATCYRLLNVWIDKMESPTVVFKTNIFVETPFAAQELLAFAILGVICGLGGAFYMQMKISFGHFLKNNKGVKAIQKANFFIYPGLISLIIVSITFPLGIGRYMASHITPAEQVISMFSNFSWASEHLTVAQKDVVKNWETKETGFYLHLVCFAAYEFVGSILASTMPIPCGSFIPNFRTGAAIGRIVGELMHSWYPTGLSYFGRLTRVIPGGYAIVGAAAYCGAVTQTMSVAVIVLEMTSQITHVLPILIAVLISNSIAQLMGLSVYNLAVKSKNLPYLPDLLPGNSAIYSVFVEDFMIPDPKYIYHGMSLEKLKNLLRDNRNIKSFPLVNNPVRRILLGSIQRMQLIELIEKHVGKDRRLQELTDEEENLLMKSRFPKFRVSTKKDDLLEPTGESKFIENPAYERPSTSPKSRSVKLPTKRICDLTPDLQKRWEDEQMKISADFSSCTIDPAPFQLVERTSLLKVHSLFSLVGINTAYVTSLGRLVGIVRLEDLRRAIEDVKSGRLQPHDIHIVVDCFEDEEPRKC